MYVPTLRIRPVQRSSVLSPHGFLPTIPTPPAVPVYAPRTTGPTTHNERVLRPLDHLDASPHVVHARIVKRVQRGEARLLIQRAVTAIKQVRVVCRQRRGGARRREV